MSFIRQYKNIIKTSEIETLFINRSGREHDKIIPHVMKSSILQVPSPVLFPSTV